MGNNLFVVFPDKSVYFISIHATLVNGKKIRYNYVVKVSVEKGSLDFSIPKTLTFCDFGKSEQEQMIQRKYKSGEEAFGLTVTDSPGKEEGNTSSNKRKHFFY
ncbi:hypothetical protein [Enterococcus faecalis]|uniref:hypothetical protein n=1 Tax=Enterococcus faecalis TaxID=1351 RepID=UPI003D10CD5F